MFPPQHWIRFKDKTERKYPALKTKSAESQIPDFISVFQL